MKCNRFSFFFLVVLSAFSLNAADVELFTPRYDAVEELEWGPTVRSVEPVTFNRELVARESTKGVQAFSAQTEKISFRISGVEYTIAPDEKWKSFHRVAGARFLSHFSVVGEAVAGEIWLPNGQHRSLITRKGTTYLIEWNDEVVAKSLVNDVSFASMNANAQTLSRKRRAVRHPSNPDACEGEWINTTDQLGLYNDRTLEWYGGDLTQFQAYVENAVKAYNATVINTTDKWEYRTRLVGLVKVSYVDNGPDDPEGMHKVREWARTSGEVKQLLDKHQADTSHFFVGYYRVGPGGAADFGTGFAVSSAVHGSFVFVHERGHADHRMGHDDKHWTNVPGGVSPMWAYDYYIDGVARGLMAYADSTNCPNQCPWQPIFATPYQNYEGINLPAGVRDVYENWRMLEWTRGTVSMNRVAGNERQCVAVSNIAPAYYNEVNF